jgi:pimeloyl-ACP methyl ester carboxylesterase
VSPSLRLWAAACLALALAAAGAARADNRLFADSKLVTLDRISVEVTGAGPDLILIPGLACSREVWKATAERLKAHYRLHLVQVAGFAGEPARANADGPVVTPTAEAIDAYIVQQKLAPAVLIGHSLGGTISLYLAEHHPDHVKKALLVDALPLYAMVMMPGANPSAEQLHGIAAQIRQGMAAASDADYAKSLEGQMAAYATGAADRDRIRGWALASDRRVVAGAVADDFELDLRPGLAANTVPISLLYPDYAPAGMAAGRADARYQGAYAQAAKVTVERIDKSLHFIMYDQPQAFADALDAFLAQ